MVNGNVPNKKPFVKRSIQIQKKKSISCILTKNSRFCKNKYTKILPPILVHKKFPGQNVKLKVCYDALVQCKCKDDIMGLVWDTKNSNSCIHKGAATILKRDLGMKLVWGACRKHVAELLLRPV